ncbi:hypothetical protein EDB80DRAFT_721120 [Ilyonectria destructans]|nr:hypothetical protein EDB80DRAFT_721120 [Ilyonectria destructans]
MMQTEGSQVEPSNESQHTILRDTGRAPPMSGITEELYTMQAETIFSTEHEQFESAASGSLEAGSLRELGHTILREHDRTPRTSAEPEMPNTMQTETGSLTNPEQLESMVHPVALQSEPPMEQEETMFRETSRNPPLTFGAPEGSDPVREASQTASSREHQQVASPTSPGSSRSHISTMPNRSDRSPTTHASARQSGQEGEAIDQARASETAQASPSGGLKMPDRSGRFTVRTSVLYPLALRDPPLGDPPLRDPPLRELKRKLESGTNTQNGHDSGSVSPTSAQHQEASTVRGHNAVIPIRGMQPQRHQPGGDARMEMEIRIRPNEQRAAKRLRLTKPDGA